MQLLRFKSCSRGLFQGSLGAFAFPGYSSLFRSGHLQCVDEEASQVADGPGPLQAVLQFEGVVDGAPEQRGDVGHGVQGDGFGLADGADVTAVTGASAFAAGLAAFCGPRRVVVEAVVGTGGVAVLATSLW